MILVIAEQKGGALSRASWEAVAAAQQLAGGVTPIKIVVAGDRVGALAVELAGAAVAEVITVEHAALSTYTPDILVQALQHVLAQQLPAYVVFPHTYQTRDFVPALAARLDRALVTDVTAIRSVHGATAFSRPMFQGKLVADRKSTRLNSSHIQKSRMPSSA